LWEGRSRDRKKRLSSRREGKNSPLHIFINAEKEKSLQAKMLCRRILTLKESAVQKKKKLFPTRNEQEEMGGKPQDKKNVFHPFTGEKKPKSPEETSTADGSGFHEVGRGRIFKREELFSARGGTEKQNNRRGVVRKEKNRERGVPYLDRGKDEKEFLLRGKKVKRSQGGG